MTHCCNIIFTGDNSKTGILKETAVPHIFEWSKSLETPAKLNRSRSARKRADREKRFLTETENVCCNVGNEEEINAPVSLQPAGRH